LGQNVTLKLDLFAVGEVNAVLGRLGQISWDQLMHEGWLHLRTNEKKKNLGQGLLEGAVKPTKILGNVVKGLDNSLT
jgi:hypothetical protein